MKFTIANQEIHLSKDYLDCATTYKELIQLIPELKNNTISIYNKYHNSDVLSENGVIVKELYQSLFDNFLKVSQKIINQLIKNDIFDFSSESFLNHTLSSNVAFQSFDRMEVLENDILDVLEAAEAEKAGREYRKAGRRKLQGGGFGLAGAAKGIAIAGAVNTTTGVFHSITNFLGNSRTTRNARNKIADLLDSSFIKSLLSTFEFDIRICFSHFLEIMLRSGKISKEVYDVFVNIDLNNRNSNVFISNLEQSNKDKNFKLNIAIEQLKKSPFSSDVYSYILLLSGDKSRNLQKLADIHLIDLLIVKEHYILTKLEEEFVDFTKVNLLDSIDPAINLLPTLSPATNQRIYEFLGQQKEELGIDKLEMLSKLYQGCQKYSVSFLDINGKKLLTFGNSSEAELAYKKQLQNKSESEQKFSKMLSILSKRTLDLALEDYKKMENSSYLCTNKYRNNILNKAISIIKEKYVSETNIDNLLSNNNLDKNIQTKLKIENLVSFFSNGEESDKKKEFIDYLRQDLKKIEVKSSNLIRNKIIDLIRQTDFFAYDDIDYLKNSIKLLEDNKKTIMHSDVSFVNKKIIDILEQKIKCSIYCNGNVVGGIEYNI